MDSRSLTTCKEFDLRATARAIGTSRRVLAAVVLLAFAAVVHWLAQSGLSVETLILAAVSAFGIAVAATSLVQAVRRGQLASATDTTFLPLSVAIAAGLATASSDNRYGILDPIGLLLVISVLLSVLAGAGNLPRPHPFTIAAALFGIGGLLVLVEPGQELVRSDFAGISAAIMIVGTVAVLTVPDTRWRVAALATTASGAWLRSREGDLPDWAMIAVLAVVLVTLSLQKPGRHARSAPSGGELTVITAVAAALFAISLTLLDDHARSFLLSGVACLGLLALTGQRALLAQREDQYAELAVLNATIEELARLDHLTALPNRAALESRLVEEVERSVRYRQPFSLLFIDIDRFKEVNDRLGHAAGDRLLQNLATVLIRTIRTPDFAARYGGEEFVILAPGTWTEDAANLGARIQAAIAAQIDGPLGRPITVSIGIAGVPEHGVQPTVVLEQADQALYAAKNAGRNRIEIARSDSSAPA